MDDDLDMLALLEAGLSAAGFDVAIVRSAEGGLLALQRTRFDVVMSDINLPGMSGLEFCSHVVSDNPEQAVMVMTAFGSMKAAIDAMRAGAYDFILKPVDLDAVTLRLLRIIRDVRTRDEARRLRQVVEGARSFGNIIGSSTEMQRTYDLLARVSPSDASALVTGESGTGKELVARALHEHGSRRNGPFVAVNCSAVPEQLLESELFGHTKGAFTDARQDRVGLFAQASGGTLFLDEIGEIPIATQPKLLRALEERRVRPVGSDREIAIDVRIVAATNRDLESAVDEGRFRADLYFRVNVIHVPLPPLRARGTDVLLLARHFLERYAREARKDVAGIGSAAAMRLCDYNWPGNVRELRNCMERAVTLTRSKELEVEDLPERVAKYRGSNVVVTTDNPSELVPWEEVERRYILRVLESLAGNRTMAAKRLGLDRKTLYRKLERYKQVDNAALP